MNIYESEGIDAIVDLRAATRELRQSSSITNREVRRGDVAEIQAAALLDIAYSLRVLAAEAAAAMPLGFEPGEPDEREADDEIDNPREIAVGDFVIGEGWDDPGRVVAVGQSEGATWLDIELAVGVTMRAWADSVELAPMIGEEAEAAGEVPAPFAIVERNGETIGDGETLATLTDEIDNDFDGDEHAAAASALDALRASEAERKAKKTATKKETKK